MNLKKIIALPALCFCVSASATEIETEDNKGVNFNVAGDIVSSYVWRGQYQTGSSFQPTLGINVSGFSLTAWGSVDFTGKGAKEVDLTASYSIAGVTIGITDYWWKGEGALNYFHYKSHKTDHIFEAGISYALPIEKFPLSLSWYTMFAGADKKGTVLSGYDDNEEPVYEMNKRGKQAYSTYVELNYPFAIKKVGLNAIVGFTPWDAPMYGTREFSVTNVSLKASKEIIITDKFSLPVYTQIIWNPNKEDIHLVLGITLR
ncbi:hypothetical protein [Coprobacter tertius]|uniref:Uncharacterized protein n=1 Tax=Coprobacter tertius TaxID=2944915 RepID=A0ABT1MDI4_9BACT|nr:hypothetical protein [Coprobacter tertius]MCP9610698.1 hypothetical protein [Coprobacter tertius]